MILVGQEDLPEAEPYSNPEADEAETLIIDEGHSEGASSHRRYAYSRTSASHSSEDSPSWKARIVGGIIVRLTMAFLSAVCMVTGLIFFILSCINGAMVLLTLFQNTLAVKRTQGSLKMTVCWALMSFGALVAIIVPRLGVGLMMFFLMLIDESSPLREMLRQRLQSVNRS